jgi:hypothetical protein
MGSFAPFDQSPHVLCLNRCFRNSTLRRKNVTLHFFIVTMVPSTVYRITYDPDLSAVISIWNGYATSTQFREGTEEQLAVMQANQSNKMLVDLREMVLIGREDQDWMDKNYIPKSIEEGLRVVAVVQPDNYFNKVAVEGIIFKINKQELKVNYFKSFVKAIEWLWSSTIM